MRVLFFVALLDTIGFGIIIPIFLYYALQLGATPQQATMFFSIYPIAIMLSAPLLGGLSDRFGRKPVLLLCLFFAAGGYLLLAVSNTLWLLAFARFIQGVMAGNIAVVQAYVADVTSESNRAKGMGTIGAASGLGFVVGPAIGAWLGGDSFNDSSLELAAYASALASLSAFFCVLIFLPESLSQAQRRSNQLNSLRFNPFAGVPKALATPMLREFLYCALLFNIAGAFAEVILPLWLKDQGLIDGPRDLMYVFFSAGLVLTLVQAKLIAPISSRLGENGMFRLGAAGYALAFVLMTLMPIFNSFVGVVIVWSLAGASMALFFTGSQSLVSKCAAANERGGVMGAYSAIGMLGRVIGPSLTGFLYAGIHPNAPFYMGAILLVLVILIGMKANRIVIAK